MLRCYFLILEELICNFLCIFYFLINLVFELLIKLRGAVSRTVKGFNSPLGPGLASQIFGMVSGFG